VSATWALNTITISGTPTASGTFNYSIPLTGGCGAVNATGTITVIDPVIINPGITLEICANASIKLSDVTITNATTISWTGGAGTFDDATIEQPTYTPNITEGGTTVTLTVTASNVGCGSVGITKQITINAIPVLGNFSF
jgi:hypothetical protein